MFESLSEELRRALADANYASPTKVQSESIPHLLSGESVIAQAKTGSGKTAAYLIPAIERGEKTLVLTPTRELAEQVAYEGRRLGKYKRTSVGVIIGGVPYSGQEDEARKDIVVGTPGRTLDLWGKGILDLSRFTMVVIDEVDRMFDMGFIDDVRMILKNASPRIYGFFSATVPTEVEDLAKEFSPQIY
ncbi:DEAD/DEAH box helicase, partial [Acidianus sp. RZ1]